MRRQYFSTVARFLVLSALVSLSPSCGGEEAASQGLLVSVYGPPAEGFAALNPFTDCDRMTLCHRVEGQDDTGCTTVDYVDKEGELSSLPLDESVSVVMECTQLVQDSLGGIQEVPVSNGRSCFVDRNANAKTEDVSSVYMLPSESFGPTVDFLNNVQSKPFQQNRWGAVARGQGYDNAILIAGGANPKDSCQEWYDYTKCISSISDTAEVFDPATGVFEVLTGDSQKSLKEPRAFAASVTLPTQEIAIFGGLSTAGGSVEPSKTVDIFDPVFRSFSVGPAMAHTRAYHTATLISSEGGGQVLLVGGDGSGTNTWEIWSPLYGSMRSGTMTVGRRNHTATLIDANLDPSMPDNIVAIIGGDTGVGASRSVNTSMEIFSTTLQTMDANPLNICGDGTAKTLHAAAYVPQRHFLFVAGGFKDAGYLTPDGNVCVWKATERVWAGKLSLKKARGGLTATNIDNTNFIVFAGGLYRDNGVLKTADTVEILLEYKDDKGQLVIDVGPFDFPIPMLYPRWNQSAVAGCDGKVLYIGGLSSSPDSPKAEAYSEVFNPGLY